MSLNQQQIHRLIVGISCLNQDDTSVNPKFYNDSTIFENCKIDQAGTTKWILFDKLGLRVNPKYHWVLQETRYQCADHPKSVWLQNSQLLY